MQTASYYGIWGTHSEVGEASWANWPWRMGTDILWKIFKHSLVDMLFQPGELESMS